MTWFYTAREQTYVDAQRKARRDQAAKHQTSDGGYVPTYSGDGGYSSNSDCSSSSDSGGSCGGDGGGGGGGE